MAALIGRLIRGVICLVLMLQSAVLLADWREALPDARLSGSGEMRLFGFSIYNAKLWSPRPMNGEPPGADVPFALELTYSRAIGRDDLVEASLKEIRRLSPNPMSPELIARGKSEMQQAFVDVGPGDRITGVNVPGEGARFYVGDKLQYVVKDEAFVNAFFAIWFDPRTRSPELRARLLGTAEP